MATEKSRGTTAGPALSLPAHLQPGRQPRLWLCSTGRRPTQVLHLVLRPVASRPAHPPARPPPGRAGRAGLRRRLEPPLPPAGGCLASTTRQISWWPRPWAATVLAGAEPPCWRAAPLVGRVRTPTGPAATARTTDMATTVSGVRPEANAGRSCRIASVTNAGPSWPTVGRRSLRWVERIRTIEEAHLVPRASLEVAPGSARPWRRGSGGGLLLSTALAVASRRTPVTWPRGISCGR